MVQAAGLKREANILLIGDGAVGKTSLVNVYNGKPFQDVQMATLGMDFISQDVTPKSNANDSYNLKIWDTAGQERFKSLTMSFYKQSHGMMVCFDLTKQSTFQSVRRWIVAVNQYCPARVATILVGTKCDLEEDRVISKEEAESLAADNNMMYFETSARSNIKVQDAFIEIIDQVYQNKFAPAGAAAQEPKRETVKLSRKSEAGAKQA